MKTFIGRDKRKNKEKRKKEAEEEAQPKQRKRPQPVGSEEEEEEDPDKKRPKLSPEGPGDTTVPDGGLPRARYHLFIFIAGGDMSFSLQAGGL